MQVANDMFAMTQIVMKQLESAYKTVHAYRTKSSLGICSGDIAEQDVPWLTLFEEFNLPMKSKEEVEKLERALEKSSEFLKFFVRSPFSIYFLFPAVILNIFFKDSSHCTDCEEFISNSKIDIGRFYLFIDVQESHHPI